MQDKYLKLLSDFRLYLEMKNFKPRGIEEIIRNARYLFSYLEENNMEIAGFTLKNAEEYREVLAVCKDEKGGIRFNPVTINGSIAELRLLFRYLISVNIAIINPFNCVEKMRESNHLPRNILSIEETGKLLKSIKVESFLDFEFKVVVEVLYSTGCRISEIENLRKLDIDTDRGIITILDDKNRRDRIAPLTEYAVKILKLYLKYFKDEAKPFMHRKKRTLNRFMNDRLKKLSKENELSVITCHSIRHTVASQLLKKGADLREVQEILGHKRIKNTEIYTRLIAEDLKKSIELYHPRERSLQ